jgi:hypothetical protein
VNTIEEFKVFDIDNALKSESSIVRENWYNIFSIHLKYIF